MAMRGEQRVDSSYRALMTRVSNIAGYQASLADVRALERLLRSIPARDAALGSKRPDVVASMVAAVEAKLDAARRLQLARDRWSLRAPAFRQYQADIAPSLTLLARLKPALEDIKALAGSTAATLRML